MPVKDDFLALLRACRTDILRDLDVRFDRAFKDGDDATLAALRRERRTLLDLPSTIVDGTRAELVAQWPADFPPVPAWFADPESVEPLGEACEIDCTPPKPLEAGLAEDLPEDLEAQILATRAERAKEEDEARRIGIENGRRVLPADLGLA